MLVAARVSDKAPRWSGSGQPASGAGTRRAKLWEFGGGGELAELTGDGDGNSSKRTDRLHPDQDVPP